MASQVLVDDAVHGVAVQACNRNATLCFTSGCANRSRARCRSWLHPVSPPEVHHMSRRTTGASSFSAKANSCLIKRERVNSLCHGQGMLHRWLRDAGRPQFLRGRLNNSVVAWLGAKMNRWNLLADLFHSPKAFAKDVQVSCIRDHALTSTSVQGLVPALLRAIPAAARCVLIGTPSNGSVEMHNCRELLTKALLLDRGFDAVCVDSPLAASCGLQSASPKARGDTCDACSTATVPLAG
jgi:hypothetical protein